MNAKNNERRRRLKTWLWVTSAALLTSLLVLVAGTVRYAQQIDRISHESARQIELNNRLRQMQAVVIALIEAETGQRGYLLTAKASYLAPYTAATARMPELLRSLEGIPLESAALAQRTKSVEELVRAKLTELAETVRLHDSGRRAEALALVNSDSGIKSMERVRLEMSGLMDELRASRDSATAELLATNASTRSLAIWSVAVMAACLLIAAAQVLLLIDAQQQHAGELTESESRHRALVEEQLEMISLAREDGTLTYVNPAYSRHFRKLTNDLLGVSLFDLVEPGDRELVRQQIDSVFRTGIPAQGENRMVSPDGSSKWLAWTNSIQRGPGGERLLHSVGRDITALKMTEQRLRESNIALERQTATLASVVEAIPAMIAVFDGEFRYRLVNRSFERWRGKPRDEVIGRGVAELFGQEEHDRSWPWAQRALAGETVSYEKAYPNASVQRHISASYVPLRLEDGTVDGIIAVAQDLTMHREEERRLLALAERDALTGVLNRAGFEHYVQAKCDAGDGARLAVLYFDLDHFKAVNDAHGHVVGDELLQQFAQRVQGLVRPSDAVARLGGDEFAVVLHGLRTHDDAEAIADTLLEAAKAPFEVRGLTLTLGASVGVAFDAGDERGWRGLVERADSAVYRAKGAGRGRRA